MHSCNGVAWLPSWSNPRLFPTAPPNPERSSPFSEVNLSEDLPNACVLRFSLGTRPECRGERCDAASQSGRSGFGHPPEYARTIPSHCDPFGKRNLVDTEKTYLSFPVSTISRFAFSPAIRGKAMRSRNVPSVPREHT